MNFYQKKVGRPTDEELGLIDAIERIITQKGMTWGALYANYQKISKLTGMNRVDLCCSFFCC